MRPLAADEEQVLFWQRHTRLGVALSIAMSVVMALDVRLRPDAPHPTAQYAMCAICVTLTPFVLALPVRRMVLHPLGRLFFDGWEAVGLSLVCLATALDGGVTSPRVLFFFVLLAHSALAYPPGGMLLAGGGIIGGFLGVGLLTGTGSPSFLVAGALTLLITTATCAFASYNHVRAYRRIAAHAEQIAALATLDGLTQCLNHRSFHDRLAAAAELAAPGRPLALLVVDVDEFKSVNDSYGHPAGDDVLAGVGRALRAVSRADDVAGRLGGDEFALLLPGLGPAAAGQVGERLRAEVGTSVAGIQVTVSIGIAVTHVPGGADDLLAAADRAVYDAKRAGRDRVTVAAAPA